MLVTRQLNAADYKNAYTALFDNLIYEIEHQKKTQWEAIKGRLY